MTDLTVLNDLRERLEQITPEHILWASRRLMPLRSGDKPVGLLPEASRRLYALWQQTRATAEKLAADASLAMDATLSEALFTDSNVHGSLACMMAAVFSAQIAADFEMYAFGTEVMMREGWQIVRPGGIEEKILELRRRMEGLEDAD